MSSTLPEAITAFVSAFDDWLSAFERWFHLDAVQMKARGERLDALGPAMQQRGEELVAALASVGETETAVVLQALLNGGSDSELRARRDHWRPAKRNLD